MDRVTIATGRGGEPLDPPAPGGAGAEGWREVWRRGFVPVLPAAALGALAHGLRTDDPQLIQRATTLPLYQSGRDAGPVEAGCPLGYMGAAVGGGFGAATVAAANEFFERACFEADQRLGAPGACCWLLNWIDDVPRDVLRRELLPEVELALSARRKDSAPAAA